MRSVVRSRAPGMRASACTARAVLTAMAACSRAMLTRLPAFWGRLHAVTARVSLQPRTPARHTPCTLRTLPQKAMHTPCSLAPRVSMVKPCGAKHAPRPAPQWASAGGQRAPTVSESRPGTPRPPVTPKQSAQPRTVPTATPAILKAARTTSKATWASARPPRVRR